MTALPLRHDFNDDSFGPYGLVVAGPAAFGARAFYSAALGADHPGCAPVLHTNRIAPTALPCRLDQMERHPHAAQVFVPLDVARYVVAVAPAAADGGPDMDRITAWLVPGHLGTIYAKGVWHAPARVLDRAASFAVLMWRGASDDDVFCSVPPVTLTEGRAP